MAPNSDRRNSTDASASGMSSPSSSRVSTARSSTFTDRTDFTLTSLRPCTADSTSTALTTPSATPTATHPPSHHLWSPPSKTSLSSLPIYSPSPDPPYYTHEPASTERIILANAGRSPARMGRSITFVKQASSPGTDFALHLFGQAEGVTVPVYGRNARVIGDVVFDKGIKHVKEVVLKLQGHVKVTVADGGSASHTIFRQKKVLWDRNSSPNNSATIPDGLELPFSIRMPSHCPLVTISREDDTDREVYVPLPPSFEIKMKSVTGLRAFVEYTITVSVKRTQRIIFRKKTVSTTIKYLPRARAPIPMLLPPNTFLSTLKSSPEEWMQRESIMKSRSGDIQPIQAHLILPKGQVYPLRANIPFHVQLSSCPQSLRELLEPSLPADDLPTSNKRRFQKSRASTSSSVPKSKLPSTGSVPQAAASGLIPPTFPSSQAQQQQGEAAGSKPKIVVSLVRQVAIHVNGQRAWEHVLLGEGEMRVVERGIGRRFITFDGDSPVNNGGGEGGAGAGAGVGGRELRAEGKDEAWISWEGEIKSVPPPSGADIDVGGFVAKDLRVMDFIILTLSPPDPANSKLLIHQHSVPVKLVTDPFESYE